MTISNLMAALPLRAALLGLALVAAPAAGQPRPVPNPTTHPTARAAPGWNVCQALDPRADGHSGCSNKSCGSNTPIVNNFPLDGAHPGGCGNADGQQLVPGSLVIGRSACPQTNLTLDLEADGTLVGRDPTTGDEICRGAALVGASFTVIATRAIGPTGGACPAFPAPRATRILISQAGVITAKQRPYPAYVLSPEDDPGKSLCDSSAGATWSAQWLGTVATPAGVARVQPQIAREPAALAPVSPAEQGRFVIPIAGAVFDRTATAFARTGASGSGWFNFACADSALAKVRLLGIETATTTEPARRAALKMLTGKYRDGVSYTTTGIAIDWRARGQERKSDLVRLEARWGENGATCVSHARLWRPHVAIPPEALAPKCVDHPCDEAGFLAELPSNLPTCDSEYTPAEPEHWSSYVIDHIKH